MKLIKKIPEGKVLGRQEIWSVGDVTVRILFATRYSSLSIRNARNMNITRRSYRKLFFWRLPNFVMLHWLFLPFRRFSLFRAGELGYSIHCDQRDLPELMHRLEKLLA